jgi:site-specific DNA-methyltransferase (adenine-specific)
MNEIKKGDCLELFKDIDTDTIDVTFADPPFNLNKKYKNCKDTLEDKKYLDWCEKWIGEMIRVTKPTGSIFIHNIPRWLIQYTGFLSKCQFKHWISWDAPSGPMGTSLQPSHYGILYYTKTKESKFYEIRGPHKRCRCHPEKTHESSDIMPIGIRHQCHHNHCLLKDYGGKKDTIHWFGPLVSDVWTDIHRIKHNKYRSKHPCQLPIHLLERIIIMSSDEGDKILDPFMGTGTTALAAKRLGRQWLGFENSKEYKDDADIKLEQETVESKIGPFWVSYFGYTGVVTIREQDCNGLLTSEYFNMPSTREGLDKTSIKLKLEYVRKLEGFLTKKSLEKETIQS